MPPRQARNSPSSWAPNALIRGWLRAGPPESGSGEAPGASGASDGHAGAVPDWESWCLRQSSRDRLVRVGRVLVDRQVLDQTFACVADRCAPGPSRGRYLSCCADAEVGVCAGERRRLQSAAGELLPALRKVEPRLAIAAALFEGGALARPGGRCICSGIDERGRIRCRLHAFAARVGLDRARLQPISCRLFPLAVIALGGARWVLTVVSRGNHHLLGAAAPARYPCLDDPGLPPLVESLRGDLDWAFGEGFARALAKARG